MQIGKICFRNFIHKKNYLGFGVISIKMRKFRKAIVLFCLIFLKLTNIPTLRGFVIKPV